MNTLEIKVTNQWTNRIIGDRLMPPEKRVLSAAPVGFRGGFGGPQVLADAGLIGPVTVVEVLARNDSSLATAIASRPLRVMLTGMNDPKHTDTNLMLHFNFPLLFAMGGGPIDSLEKLIAHIVVFGLALWALMAIPAAIAACVLIVIGRRKARLSGETTPAEQRRAVKPKLRWYQFSLGRLLFISLLALSSELLRKAYLAFDPVNAPDDRWLISGLCLLGGTIGFTIQRRYDPDRSGMAWMLIGVLLGLLMAVCIAACTER